MSSPQLVIVTGPIASGKTTVILKLAELARQRGEMAAAIDLDLLIEMIAGTDWSVVAWLGHPSKIPGLASRA